MTEQEQAQATQECLDIEQHFVAVVSNNGYDVCFNCGGTE